VFPFNLLWFSNTISGNDTFSKNAAAHDFYRGFGCVGHLARTEVRWAMSWPMVAIMAELASSITSKLAL